ncbi:MAG: amidase [Chloroflexota bacterium]
MAELWALSAVELRRRLASGDVSSVEAVEAALDRLLRLEPKLNAFVTVMADEARAAARKADDELAKGQGRGPLHGVPVSIKDMFNTAGVRTTGASKILEQWVPDADSALVERLRAAGAILIGKGNQDEFGHGGTSTLSHFGPVHNPWDFERIAGGSSGGSTAAVAAGIGPIAFGTETGSSVRRPSAYCGIFGFKPTFGIVSRYGSFRGAWSMDHVGVFGRTVADATLGLDVVAGYDPRDPASVAQAAPGYSARLSPAIAGLRVGILPNFLADAAVTPPVRQAFDVTVDVLRRLGAKIVELDVPELRYAAMTSMLTSSAEASANNVEWLRERPGDFVTTVRRRLASGLSITASEYLTVQRARYRIREAMREVYQRVDVVASPTTNRVAPKIDEGSTGSGDETFRPSYNQSNILRFPSMLGLPGCSVPCGADLAGLPIGAQLVARWFADQSVLNLALAYEGATDWHKRRPPLD